MRPEATGYGTVYFAEEMLKHVGSLLLVKLFRYLVLVTLRSMLLKSNVLRCKSGYAIGLKWYRLFKNGFTDELLAEVMELKISSVAVFQNLLLSMALNILKGRHLGIFL